MYLKDQLKCDFLTYLLTGALKKALTKKLPCAILDLIDSLCVALKQVLRRVEFFYVWRHGALNSTFRIGLLINLRVRPIGPRKNAREALLIGGPFIL